MPASSDEAVRVVVQARPLLPFEAAHGAVQTLQLEAQPPLIRISRPTGPELCFAQFDAVYDSIPGDRPDGLYDDHVESLVDGLFEGLNATVFAYGQTSAGKSYTMQHVTSRVARHVFGRKKEAEQMSNVTVRVGFVEIYRERIRDLVDGTKAPLGVVNVQVRERKRKGKSPIVFLDGAKERCVTTEEELIQIISDGALVRQTASTGMNASSSRSHSIITITVQQEPVEGKGECLAAKLHLVDLAGSERAKRTAVEGERFTEGVDINKGLLALAKVIVTLASNANDRKGHRAHVPYRDSKLTRILQDSLGGNARTLLVACVSPADTSREETLSTLRYAERAKCIRNKPKVNTEANSVEISDLRAALARAKAEIAALASENERLRRCVGVATIRGCATSVDALKSISTDTLTSIPSSSYTDSSPSPRKVRQDPLIVTREDDITGLRLRVAELEGMLERANLSSADRVALHGYSQEAERVMKHSPLGKLKHVGLAAFSHDSNESKKKSETRSRTSGPKRRMRSTKTDWSRSAPAVSGRKRSGSAKTGESRSKSPSSTERGTQVGGGLDDLSPSPSVTLLKDQNGRNKSNDKASPTKESPTTSTADLFDFDENNIVFENNGADDAEVMNALSASRLDEIRRTFAKRLRQTEADKVSLDSQRIQLIREMATLQKKHEKELEELKTNHNVKLAGMRSKLADVRRLEAESTRLHKLQDGKDVARKKLLTKLKATEKARDEVMSRLSETLMRTESQKRCLDKEIRELEKTERRLRTELRKSEMGKSRQEAIINRLRLENTEMKNKLRDAGRQHVRRTNSGITPRTAAC